jgi:hypothetical protein
VLKINLKPVSESPVYPAFTIALLPVACHKIMLCKNDKNNTTQKFVKSAKTKNHPYHKAPSSGFDRETIFGNTAILESERRVPRDSENWFKFRL